MYFFFIYLECYLYILQKGKITKGVQELLEQSPVFRPVDKILFGSQSTKDNAQRYLTLS